MTYQKTFQTNDDDNAVEVSSLLLTVAGGGGGGVPATQKKNGGVPTMRARIATTCFLLGTTLAVIYYGGRGRSSTASSAGISAALLLDQWTVPVVYDPDQDYCFMDSDNYGKFCWFPKKNREPCGNWEKVIAAGSCGTPCTGVYHFDEDPGCSKTSRTDRCLCEPVYDPRYYYCFRDTDNPGKYCWFDASTPPPGNWVGEGGHGIDGCGDECFI